jgi:Tol biopolymer transport system component
MTPSKAKLSRLRLSLLDSTVWTVALLLVGALVVMASVSDPTRRGAEIAYLYPAYGGTQNIWLAPLDDPSQASQYTQEKGGIFNFDVSSDGRFIVYAARDITTGLNDLFLLDLQTRRIQALTNCAAENADCHTPAIKPDGKVVAYERMGFTAASNGAPGGGGAIRIWLVDISKQPFTTRPLTDDAQFVGHSPQWAQSGDTLAFYSADIANPGIMVYNFIPREGEKSLKFIPASNGIVGSISPNGRKLVFPDVITTASGYGTMLKSADLDELKFDFLTSQNEPAEDNAAAWHPDGQRLAIARKYSDNRYTPGFQIYLFDPQTQDVQPLAYDQRYSHGYFQWNVTGDKLLYQRIALGEPEAKPEVGIRDMKTGENSVVVLNAFHPRWVLP